MSKALLACLETLAGPHVSVGLSEVGNEDGLLTQEMNAIARAVPKRRAEFAAGRRAARLALRIAGHRETAIPKGEHRAPVWPGGFVGSLSHDNGIAVACVARTSDIECLGVDLTEAADFPDHLRREILRTPTEEKQSGIEARLNFSAKESVFKAFYPSVGNYFGFDAVEVLPDLDAARFSVLLRRPLGRFPAGVRLDGRFGIIEDRLLTLLTVPARLQP